MKEKNWYSTREVLEELNRLGYVITHSHLRELITGRIKKMRGYTYIVKSILSSDDYDVSGRRYVIYSSGLDKIVKYMREKDDYPDRVHRSWERFAQSIHNN